MLPAADCPIRASDQDNSKCRPFSQKSTPVYDHYCTGKFVLVLKSHQNRIYNRNYFCVTRLQSTKRVKRHETRKFESTCPSLKMATNASNGIIARQSFQPAVTVTAQFSTPSEQIFTNCGMSQAATYHPIHQGEQRRTTVDSHSLDTGSPRAGSASSTSSSTASSPKIYRSIDALLGLGATEAFGIAGTETGHIGNGKFVE